MKNPDVHQKFFTKKKISPKFIFETPKARVEKKQLKNKKARDVDISNNITSSHPQEHLQILSPILHSLTPIH